MSTLQRPITPSHIALAHSILAQKFDPDGPPFIEQSAALIAESEAAAVERALREPDGFYKDLAEACELVGFENRRLSAALATANGLRTVVSELAKALRQSRDANACVSYGRAQVEAVEAANAALKLVPEHLTGGKAVPSC